MRMRTCSVQTGVEVPERLLEGVIESGEPVNVRVGVLEGYFPVADLEGAGQSMRLYIRISGNKIPIC